MMLTYIAEVCKSSRASVTPHSSAVKHTDMQTIVLQADICTLFISDAVTDWHLAQVPTQQQCSMFSVECFVIQTLIDAYIS